MWIPTEDDAVGMFARHFEALHRSGALPKAESKASALENNGDQYGHRVWLKVADRIRDLRRPDAVEKRRESEAV